MRTSNVEQFVLELFRQHPADEAHFSAQEIYQQLKPRLPSINPSTVYRALERMTHAGIVSVSDMGLGAVVYEAIEQKPHHHLVCEGCKKVLTLEHEAVQPFFDALKQRCNFRITTNHLVLFGYCEDCQQEKDSQTEG